MFLFFTVRHFIAFGIQRKEILFPGYFSREKIDPVSLKYTMGQAVTALFDMLSEQITHSIRHDCFRYNLSCSDCGDRGYKSHWPCWNPFLRYERFWQPIFGRRMRVIQQPKATMKSFSATQGYMPSASIGSLTSF